MNQDLVEPQHSTASMQFSHCLHIFALLFIVVQESLFYKSWGFLESLNDQDSTSVKFIFKRNQKELND
jgi:hypothetical protein